MALPENPEKNRALLGLGISLFFGVLAFFPLSLPKGVSDIFFAVFFPFFLIGSVISAYCYCKSMELDCLFAGEGLLAHWQYPQGAMVEEENDYLEAEDKKSRLVRTRDVYIGQNGIFFGDKFYTLYMGGNGLESIAVDGEGKKLEITMVNSAAKLAGKEIGEVVTTLRIPIPQGGEASAQEVIDYFTKGEGAETRAVQEG